MKFTAERPDLPSLEFVELAAIPYSATFDLGEFTRMQAGFKPLCMEDKWLIFFEDSKIFLHRSWTGKQVYVVCLESCGEHFAVSEAFCACYVLEQSSPSYESELLDFLISNLLLGKNKPFPRPVGIDDGTSGLYQHLISGSGYPERVVPFARKAWWRFWQ